MVAQDVDRTALDAAGIEQRIAWLLVGHSGGDGAPDALAGPDTQRYLAAEGADVSVHCRSWHFVAFS